MGKRILIVEDEVVSAMALEKSLSLLGFNVIGFVTTGEEALDRVAREQPEIIAMDIRLAGAMDGIEAASRIMDVSDAQIVFMTGYDDEKIRQRALALKPLDMLNKPVNGRHFDRFR
jgi:CheY-like chemotaxis protein